MRTSIKVFFFACVLCLALAEDTEPSLVNFADADINFCMSVNVADGSCTTTNAKSELVSTYDDEEGIEGLGVWQLFSAGQVFPYKITDLYFMFSAYISDDECDGDPTQCPLEDFTVVTAPAKVDTDKKHPEGCTNYTYVPDLTNVKTIENFDNVLIYNSRGGSLPGYVKVPLTNPIVVTDPFIFVGFRISISSSSVDSFGSLYIYGSKGALSYCHPYALENALDPDSRPSNPFESVVMGAHIEKFSPTQLTDIPDWKGTLEQYNDKTCDCGKGMVDPACLQDAASTDCKSNEVCWDGVCKAVGWKASSNPLHGQEYEACDVHHYGTDDICDLGCGEGLASLDPDCLLGRKHEISYPGASRVCERSLNTCGPELWQCALTKFNDGKLCDCNCGAQDPDCDNINLTTTCPNDNMCVDGVCTVPKSWTCDPKLYNSSEDCNCECGAVDPDCYLKAHKTSCGDGRHCSSEAICILDECGDGEVNPSAGQDCDSGSHCGKDCKCEIHFQATFPPGKDCKPICGDKYVVEGEECDSSGGCLPNCTCEPQYTPKGGKCVGCGNGEVDEEEECDGGENCNQKTCKCKSGYQSETGTNGCSKKSNVTVVVVVSVCVAVVVIAAACVIVFVIIPIIHRRREANSTDDDGDVPMGEVGESGEAKKASPQSVSPMNTMCVLTPGAPKLTAAPFVGQRNYIKETWSVTPEETDFNTSGLDVEVGATQQQMFELRNMAPSQMQFSVNVPRSNKFLVTAFPEKGAIKSGGSASFRVQITLYCNVELDQVPFAISVQFDGEEKNQQYTLVPMKIRAQRSNRIDYDDLVFEETVGEGSFGSVWRGKYQNQVVAIKTLRTITESALKDFLREIEMLAQFNNPYIMGYFGSVITNDKLCMVIEYLSMGSLSALLKQYHLSPRLKTRLALDSVKGLAYLHTLNIMHRDIKPGNVLVSSFDPSEPDAICKIADFGTSRVLNGSAEDQAALQKGLGTPLYMAPEILGSNKTYTQSADVYSFGIMLAHIWNEKSPYSDLHFDTPWALANYVSSGNRPQIDEGCPQAFYQLMTQCWQADPSQRPSFQQCVEFLEQLNNLFAEQPEEPGFVHYTQKLE